MTDIDQALRELDHKLTEVRIEHLTARRTLLEAGLQIDMLRRDEAGVARRRAALAELEREIASLSPVAD